MLDKHAANVCPEVEACERTLSCVIEGVKTDRILVRFLRLDPSDQQREFSFVLDVGDTYKGLKTRRGLSKKKRLMTILYTVITSSPVLPSLAILTDELNNSRDIFQFIKRVRIGYQELVRSGC